MTVRGTISAVEAVSTSVPATPSWSAGRPRRRAADAHRRAGGRLGRHRPDVVSTHRRARQGPRRPASSGPDPPRHLVLLHVEPRGRRGRECGGDRSHALPAGTFAEQFAPVAPASRLLHAGRSGHAARRGEEEWEIDGVPHASRARSRRTCPSSAARADELGTSGTAHGPQLRPADVNRREDHDRRGGEIVPVGGLDPESWRRPPLRRPLVASA